MSTSTSTSWAASSSTSACAWDRTKPRTSPPTSSRAWSHRHDYDPERGEPQAWLWAIARNAARDCLRRRRPAWAALPPDAAGSPDPAMEIGRQREWARIEQGLSTLAARDREIIALRFGARMTNRAIAALLGMGEASAAQRLRRALRKMRTIMEGGATW